jgi:hypothetical protein
MSSDDEKPGMTPVDVEEKYSDNDQNQIRSSNPLLSYISIGIFIGSILPFGFGILLLVDAISQARDPERGLAAVAISIIAMAFVTVAIAMLLYSAYLNRYVIE